MKTRKIIIITCLSECVSVCVFFHFFNQFRKNDFEHIRAIPAQPSPLILLSIFIKNICAIFVAPDGQVNRWTGVQSQSQSQSLFIGSHVNRRPHSQLRKLNRLLSCLDPDNVTSRAA